MAGLAQGLANIREVSPEMPLGCLVIFLEVVANAEDKSKSKDPPMIRDVSNSLGIPYATVVRSLLFLSKIKQPGVSGLGWIETHTWPMDRRQKYVTITPAGQRAIENLKKTIAA